MSIAIMILFLSLTWILSWIPSFCVVPSKILHILLLFFHLHLYTWFLIVLTGHIELHTLSLTLKSVTLKAEQNPSLHCWMDDWVDSCSLHIFMLSRCCTISLVLFLMWLMTKLSQLSVISRGKKLAICNLLLLTWKMRPKIILRYLRDFMCYRQKPTDGTWCLVWHKKWGRNHVYSGVEELGKGHDHF